MKTENRQYEKIKIYRDELYDFFNKYDYHWSCTLCLPSYNVEDTEKYLKIWCRNLSKRDKIQVCYVGVIVLSKFTGPHVHLLMYGKNRHGETLLDRDIKTWEDQWYLITHRSCVIKTIYDKYPEEYISNWKNTPPDYFELVHPRNPGLLKKIQKKLN